MTQERREGQTVSVEDADFEAFYRGERPLAGPSVDFGGCVPWDIGEPQPALVELERNGLIRGEVLDAGCGTGDNTLFLTERGYPVTGFDGAPTALELARRRAQDRGLDPDFVEADATRLEGFEQRFDTILDSALYHCLGDGQRREYSAALHRVANPGAHLHLFCFSDAEPEKSLFPVSQDDLRTNLGAHWDIGSITPTNYTSSFTREIAGRMFSQPAFQDTAMPFDPDSADTDEQGRILLPVWYLHAVRR
ncbi:hypothetical protein DB35_16995 [Streptomyces abyssalis]|uniref:Methyltransferase domain-containing protein n=1 Tax=Streptomyces abyssalis TaxID=933944 RepID=A0A1E7JLV4_9ACTN|nr:class I SAM-dependent methyltransferase [Streptomyces abyssalis]OEU88631.1 hypothetical protein AN215_18170 [Streptomyces abyssalis]OEU91281.1 hypothetical protein DB35_16995 [Streptomyces abyssalis]